MQKFIIPTATVATPEGFTAVVGGVVVATATTESAAKQLASEHRVQVLAALATKEVTPATVNRIMAHGQRDQLARLESEREQHAGSLARALELAKAATVLTLFFGMFFINHNRPEWTCSVLAPSGGTTHCNKESNTNG